MKKRGKMSRRSPKHRSAAAILWIATLLQAGARRVCASAYLLDAWLHRRQMAAAALADFGSMSERDLLDIGLSRFDVQRVAWGASDRPARQHPL